MASALLRQILEKIGKDPEDFSRRSRVGAIFRAHGVTDSEDLKRVLALPSRDLELESEEALEVAALLTREYKTHWGTMSLFPVQAYALIEAHDFGALLAPIPVGGGKTLVSLLLPTVVEAKRPLLLIPAKHIPKTEAAYSQLARHWKIKMPEIMSYEKLGRTNYKEFLIDYNPDVIVCDEAHKLKNRKASVTARVERFLKARLKTGQPCKFFSMSGTYANRSIKAYAHLAKWSFGDLSPLPLKEVTVLEWADALDEKVEAGKRLAPGALMRFCDTGVEPSLDNVRRGFQKRLRSTPGVVAYYKSSVSCSLTLTGLTYPMGPQMDEHFSHLRTRWETPDGHPFSFAPELWRHARELAMGFYNRWNPRPPAEWISARKDWASFVREVIKYKPFDSELDVANAIDLGQVKDPFGYLSNWRAVKPAFVPNSEAVWEDDSAIEAIAKWASKNKGILWVEHRPLGRRLQKELGFRYFQSQGKDEQGSIEDTSPEKDGCIIAAIKSIGEGFNLQKHWTHNLITSSPTTNTTYEQLIGRTHRTGQEADEVVIDVMLGCIEQWAGLRQAISEAQRTKDTEGGDQKLLLADKEIPSEEEIIELGIKTARWRK